jgi:hypothetical protein
MYFGCRFPVLNASCEQKQEECEERRGARPPRSVPTPRMRKIQHFMASPVLLKHKEEEERSEEVRGPRVMYLPPRI